MADTPVPNEPIDAESRIRDFVVCCFLLGNDFLPKAPCLFIHDDGIEHILSAYVYALETLPAHRLTTSGGDIDLVMLGAILEQLGATEGFRMQAFHRKNRHRFMARQGATELEVELAEYDAIHPFPDDSVQLGRAGWKDRYYRTFFDVDRHAERRRIAAISKSYVQTMAWALRYYTYGVPSWSWFYPHHHAPPLSDVARYLASSKDAPFQFVMGKPVEPVVQLLCVLPPQSFALLDDTLRALVESKRLPWYPSTFEEDCTNKRKRWQTVPLLPFVTVPTMVSLVDTWRASHKKKRGRDQLGELPREAGAADETSDRHRRA